MAPITYKIDPDADTVIVLKKACTSFAAWEVAQPNFQSQFGWGFGVSKTPKGKKKKKKKHIAQAIEEPLPPPSEPEPEPEAPPVPEEPEPEPAVPEEPQPEPEPAEPEPAEPEPVPEEPEPEPAVPEEPQPEPEPAEPEPAEPEPVPEEPEPEPEPAEPEPEPPNPWSTEPEPAIKTGEEGTHFYVSSRHLMLASPWFKRALTKDGWNESGRAETDGRFHIIAEDWDTEAFLVVLRIFHLRHRQVPRTISLEMLAKIAILVDYYDCGEALEPFTEIWIRYLRKSALPSVYGRDLVLWVWVSWVFDFADEFKRATAVAIKHSSESMRTLELPIPLRVAEEIDRERYLAIDSVIDGVHGLLDKYRKADYVCPFNNTYSFQCGSFLLGALTRELDRLGLFMPRPQSPFLGLSFDGVCEKLRTIKTPLWSVSSTDYYSYPQSHPCALGKAVVLVISVAEAAIIGLDVVSMKTGKGKVKA